MLSGAERRPMSRRRSCLWRRKRCQSIAAEAAASGHMIGRAGDEAAMTISCRYLCRPVTPPRRKRLSSVEAKIAPKDLERGLFSCVLGGKIAKSCPQLTPGRRRLIVCIRGSDVPAKRRRSGGGGGVASCGWWRATWSPPPGHLFYDRTFILL